MSLNGNKVEARDAPLLLQELRRESSALQANHLMKKEYKIPDLAEALMNLEKQNQRLQSVEEIGGKISELEEEMENMLERPGMDNPVVIQHQELLRTLGRMKFEGKFQETKLRDCYRDELRKRQEDLNKDKAIASKFIKFVLDKVDSKTKSMINAIVDNFEEDPGGMVQAAMKIVVEEIRGDQDYIRETIIDEIKSMKIGKNNLEIVENIGKIRNGITKYELSLAMQGQGGSFDAKIAMRAVERVCLDNQVATTTIRDCKKEEGMTFQIMDKRITDELERVNNLKQSGIKVGEKEIKAMQDEYEGSAVAMQASSSAPFRSGGGNTCMQWSNGGYCSFGSRCRFSHGGGGEQSRPQQQKWNRQEHRGRERERDRSRERDGRNRSDNRNSASPNSSRGFERNRRGDDYVNENRANNANQDKARFGGGRGSERGGDRGAGGYQKNSRSPSPNGGSPRSRGSSDGSTPLKGKARPATPLKQRGEGGGGGGRDKQAYDKR